ncbi:MAG: PEP-CTERM sorting domain-containing protein [Phycisphaerae bacterium]|jgi:hypothetical protein|nr:PEP-CTERM sorting domain-containing protein [Phycisphaerae bacterium]
MRRILPTLTAVVLLAFAASPAAFAADVWGGPPNDTWNRGDPGSTWQHWDFCDPVVHTPCEGQNEYGTPGFEFEEPGAWQWVAELPPLDPGDTQSYPIDGWQFNGPAGSTGTLILHIPNRPRPNEEKLIFLQITSSKGPSGVTALGFDSAAGGTGYTSGTWPTGKPQIQHPNGWYTYNYGLSIRPNPEFEDIVIDVPAGTIIDQIVVDTICTPEPATLSFLAIGGLAVLRKRRKQ